MPSRSRISPAVSPLTRLSVRRAVFTGRFFARTDENSPGFRAQSALSQARSERRTRPESVNRRGPLTRHCTASADGDTQSPAGETPSAEPHGTRAE